MSATRTLTYCYPTDRLLEGNAVGDQRLFERAINGLMVGRRRAGGTSTRSPQGRLTASAMAKTVLVVEDDPSFRVVAEEMFVAAGFEVESVQRADQAVDIVAQRSEQTAFLFTDVQTPGPVDGIDLARLVKTHWPHVEVLVTSALFRRPFSPME